MSFSGTAMRELEFLSQNNGHKCLINTSFLASFPFGPWRSFLDQAPALVKGCSAWWLEGGAPAFDLLRGSSCGSWLPEHGQGGAAFLSYGWLLSAFSVPDPLLTSFHLLSYSITVTILQGVVHLECFYERGKVESLRVSDPEARTLIQLSSRKCYVNDKN